MAKFDPGKIEQLIFEIGKLQKQIDGSRNEQGRFISKNEVDAMKVLLENRKQALDIERKLEVQAKITEAKIRTQGDLAKQLGDNIESAVESIPFFGSALTKVLDVEDLGDTLQKDVLNTLNDSEDAIKKAGAAQKYWNAQAFLNPYVALAAVVVGFVALLVKAATAARDLSKEIGTSVLQAGKLNVELLGTRKVLGAVGQDSDEIAKSLIDNFGTLENVTRQNILDIGFLTAEFGAQADSVVKFQKVFSDLTGQSLDASESILRTIGKLAQAEGVAAGKVIDDIATNAEAFAEFSRDGADGLAQAAVAAAKVGSNLSVVLGIADKLLDFESSLTAEFEAQVLTGKQLNLERARQLSLEGDIEGLTREVQQTIGSLGEIQRLNVIERRSIANAIGISVDELLKISRGEQIQERETVQQKIDITNKLLAESNDKAKAYYESDLKKKGETGIGFGL